MTAPITRVPDHRWTGWLFNAPKQRWYRHCVIGKGTCTAVESAPRGAKPKAGK